MNIIIATRLVAGLPSSLVFVVPDTVLSADVRDHDVPAGWSLTTVTGDCLEVISSAKSVASVLKKNTPLKRKAKS